MNVPAVDFHSHIDLYPDPKRVAEQVGVCGAYVLSVTTTPTAWKGTVALAQGHHRIRTALGLHPQIAHERLRELPLFDRLLPEVRYVGEIGLDGGPECRRYWREQTRAFDFILAACVHAGGRVMSVHSRRAATEVLDCLDRHPGAGTPVLHWFSGTYAELERATAMGCWFSVGPAMTKGKRGRELLAAMPRGRILTETDGPFGTVKGSPLAPGDVASTIDALAACWDVGPDEAASAVLQSLRQLVTSVG